MLDQLFNAVLSQAGIVSAGELLVILGLCSLLRRGRDDLKRKDIALHDSQESRIAELRENQNALKEFERLLDRVVSVTDSQNKSLDRIEHKIPNGGWRRRGGDD